MRKTKTNFEMEKPLTYTADGLQNALGCGRHSAEKIGAAAGARIVIGRRVLYNRKKIEAYLEEHSGV